MKKITDNPDVKLTVSTHPMGYFGESQFSILQDSLLTHKNNLVEAIHEAITEGEVYEIERLKTRYELTTELMHDLTCGLLEAVQSPNDSGFPMVVRSMN